MRGVDEVVQDGVVKSLFSGVAFRDFFVARGQVLIEKFDTGLPKVSGVPISIIWFIGFAIVATWVLLRTRISNWIYAAGGEPNAARNSGVPVSRVKTGLFMLTACAAALVAILTVDAGSTDARRGVQKEFEVIIAAVIGGCLLTGGYGSAIGAFVGAIIFGVVSIGLTYTTFDSDWFQVFLGAMLLIAVCATVHSPQSHRRTLSGSSDHADTNVNGRPPIIDVRKSSGIWAGHCSLRRFDLGPGGRGPLSAWRQWRGSRPYQNVGGRSRPTSGEYLVEGKPVSFASPRDALDAEIATVYQDLAMIPLMSITRNFFMGREPWSELRDSGESISNPPMRSRARRCTGLEFTCAIPIRRSVRCRAASANAWPSRGQCISARRCYPDGADLGAWRRPDLDGAQVDRSRPPERARCHFHHP